MKSKLWTFVLVLVLLALVGGMVFCVVKITSNETTKSVTALNFQIGNLNESGGFNKNDTSTMVTKDFLTLEDIEITLPEGSAIQYKVFYFNEDGTFISTDESYSTSAYAPESIPEGATKVKIVVKPISDPEISFFEISKYAKQITIKVSK